jgi:hypothetical protein
VLTYKPNMTPCDGCREPSPRPGSLATAKPGVKLKTKAPARAEAQPAVAPTDAPDPTAGPEVGFQVVWRKDGTFSAIITVPARQAGRHWNLRFEIAGTRITQVWGAQWEPGSGVDGGLASGLGLRPGQPWFPGSSASPGGPGAGQSPPPGVPGPAWHRVEGGAIRFLVIAQGNPVTPEDCLLNAASCHFG